MNFGTIRERFLGYIMVFFAGVLWGTSGLFVLRLNQYGVPPASVSFSGHFVAVFPMAIYLLIKKGKNAFAISKKGLIFSIFLGVLTKGIMKLAYDQAVTLVGGGMTTILTYLAPLFTAVLSVLLFKERLRLYQKFALAINLIGCVLMVTGGNFKDLSINGLGLVLGITAAFLYALSATFGKVATSNDDPITMAFYMLLFSALTMFLWSRPWTNIAPMLQPGFVLWAVLNGVLTGMLGNVLFFLGLGHGVDSSRVTIIASVEVVVSVLIAVTLLNENINGVGIFGVFLLLFSIVLMNMRFREVVKVDESQIK